ncbi:Uncharacterised protein [Bordetella pertussis]|nr:Uncharacterised protein [Bordetella pertussis]
MRKAAAARTATAVPSASLARSLSCPPEAGVNSRRMPARCWPRRPSASRVAP